MQQTAIKNRKLADAKTLQEATKILDANNIGPKSAIRKLVGLAYKMTDDSDKKHTLQEADESVAMGKDEPYADRGAAKNAQNQKQSDELNKEARENSGDESHLHGNPGDGDGSDVPNPEYSRRSDQENAKEAPGTSQLGGANKEALPYYQMLDNNPSPDLLNKKIIELMDPTNGLGLSKVAAEQQAGTAARDQMGFMQEALRPVLTKIWNDRNFLMKENAVMREPLDIIKSNKEAGKISLMKISGPGGNSKNQEALFPGQDPTVSDSVLQLEKIASDPLALEKLGRHILSP
jgi:hypothetical protein